MTTCRISRPSRGARASARRNPRLALAWVCSICSALLASPLVAVEAWATGDFSRSGAYAVGGVSLAVEDFRWLDQVNAALGNTTPQPGDPIERHAYSLDTYLGAGLHIGYRLSPWVAIEGEFEWMRANLYLEVTDRSDPLRFVSKSLKQRNLVHWMAAVAAKLYPLHGRLQPFALVGLGGARSDSLDREEQLVHDAGLALRVGGGLEVYATRHLAASLSASYVVGTGAIAKDPIAQANLALMYRF